MVRTERDNKALCGRRAWLGEPTDGQRRGHGGGDRQPGRPRREPTRQSGPIRGCAYCSELKNRQSCFSDGWCERHYLRSWAARRCDRHPCIDPRAASVLRPELALGEGGNVGGDVLGEGSQPTNLPKAARRATKHRALRTEIEVKGLEMASSDVKTEPQDPEELSAQHARPDNLINTTVEASTLKPNA